MAAADVEDGADTADVWLEDVAGLPGTAFALADHVALAAGLGRWQAAGPFLSSWTSRSFLRTYAASKDLPWQVLHDDHAWLALFVIMADVWVTDSRTHV